MEISQNFVAFSEYMNFTQELGMLVGGYLIAQAPGPNWLHSFFFEVGQKTNKNLLHDYDWISKVKWKEIKKEEKEKKGK